jgi:hypothetical protein
MERNSRENGGGQLGGIRRGRVGGLGGSDGGWGAEQKDTVLTSGLMEMEDIERELAEAG